MFTPLWIVDKQVSEVEKEFLDLSLSDYINKKWIEITCGEAPYIVTRYDSTTGKSLSLEQRVVFLDRKLQRIACEIKQEDCYFDCVVEAFKNSYGYEYQGDSLLLAL